MGQNPPHVLQALKNLWTKQLYLEYERICFHYRVKLSPVSLVISEWKDKLGEWDARARVIRLSQNLIQKHCWSLVLEVLKHEMAHQIVSEIYGQHDHHGPYFQQACRRLGVADWASHATLPLMTEATDLKNFFHQPFSPPEEERMLRKAQKLLALASSPNAFEAMQAMKKVQYLYETYHVLSLRKLEKSDFFSLYVNHKKKRTELYQTMIGSLLVRHFYVQVIHGQLYDAQSMCEHKTIEILGLIRHVHLAEYAYWFLYNHLPALWRDYAKQSHKKGMRARNQFFQGVVAGFDEKLQDGKVAIRNDLCKEADAGSLNALILAEDKRLQGYVKSRHPRVSYTGFYTYRRDESSYEAGKKKGRELNLHKGISSQTESAAKRYLPAVR